MSQGEFDIIKRYFQRPTNKVDGVEIGIGDDCAILDVPERHQLAVTTDSLVSGVHFFHDVDAYRLGYKSLAVNLSDLAAMGATAKWVSLAITLPTVDETWLADFCRGFFALADKYNVQLIGGDTTKGPLSITVSAKGIVKTGQALTRSGAQVGDVIFVSGCLGDGALGLAVKLLSTEAQQLTPESQQAFINALELTEPRLELAKLLVGYASSCIDISDGLSQDLSHILKKSQCNAEITLEKLPFSDAMLNEIKLSHLPLSQVWQYAVNGGDDYELVFTIPADKVSAFHTLLKTQSMLDDVDCYEIGKITESKLIDCNKSTNIPSTTPSILFTHLQQPVDLNSSGWDHFK
jgi:thiamine-monophosphate kinase